MNKQFNKRIRIIALSLLLLIVVSISFSFAYIRGGTKNNESISTVALKGGNINIRYENNSGEIIANDIVPGFEVTKQFTITSEFGNRDYYTSGVWYTVALIIDKNEFDDNSIEYSLSLDDTSNSEGLVLPNRENIGVPNGSTSNRVIIGSGRIYSNNVSHTYNLKISYPYRRGNQSHEIGCEFHAHIDIIDTDYVKLAFNLDGGRFNNLNLYNNSVDVPANSIINLPIPNKEGYIFAGWEVLSVDASISRNVILTNTNAVSLKALYAPSSPYEFDYTGGEQEFIAEYSGYYKLETWGAQGGSSSITEYGGYGAYSFGEIYLIKDDKLYINVGGTGIYDGAATFVQGGYNGGGSVLITDNFSSSGGGATHIALDSGELYKLTDHKNDNRILIVSAGGGGCGLHFNRDGISNHGGSGGGIQGENVINYSGNVGNNNYTIYGGTQDEHNASDLYTYGNRSNSAGTFGKGGDTMGEMHYSSGGGAGWYGGTGGFGPGGGAGGSSYIGNIKLANKATYCFNCVTSNVESTKTYTTACTEEIPTENCAKKGNGYAIITYLHN